MIAPSGWVGPSCFQQWQEHRKAGHRTASLDVVLITLREIRMTCLDFFLGAGNCPQKHALN